VLILGGPQVFAQPNKPNTLTCPASVTVVEKAETSPPWQSEQASAQHKFLRPSLYNGTRGKQEYELAPDREEIQGRRVLQTWILSDYRDMNIFVRCRYENAGATVAIDLPASLKICVFSFDNSAKKDSISSPSFECK
jgi:hypothetical protein